MKKIIVIAGATASGKSDLAVRLAKERSGVVVNADSIQVYRDIPLLTARPSVADMGGVPHFLYGFLNEHETMTVASWLEHAARILKDAENPVVVGGTGMYINALVNGFNDIPPVEDSVREQVRQMPLEEVKRRVLDCPATDPQRLRRALEVQLSTGKPLAWFQAQPRKKAVEADFVKIWLNPPRKLLYERCDARFLKMLRHGAVDEVKALVQKKPTGGVTKAIGFSQINAWLQGDINEHEMIKAATQATRNYAKRQITWFKNQLDVDYVLDDSSQVIDL